MRIHSFVKPEALLEKIVTLSTEESHHLARVLRVEAGQEMTLFAKPLRRPLSRSP